MPYGISGRYSYLRAEREIEHSVQLEKLLAKVDRIGSVALGALGVKDVTHLKWPDTIEEELQPGYIPVSEELGITTRVAYPSHRIWYRHFERLAKPEEGLNKAIAKVYARLAAEDEKDLNGESLLHSTLKRVLEKRGVDDSTGIIVRSSTLAVSTKPQYAHLGEEYALRLDPGPNTDVLLEQNEIIYNFIRSMGPGSELCRGYQPPTDAFVPIARLPRNTEASQKDKFVDWVSDSLWAQPITLVAGDVDWHPQTPRVSTFS